MGRSSVARLVTDEDNRVTLVIPRPRLWTHGRYDPERDARLGPGNCLCGVCGKRWAMKHWGSCSVCWHEYYAVGAP